MSAVRTHRGRVIFRAHRSSAGPALLLAAALAGGCAGVTPETYGTDTAAAATPQGAQGAQGSQALPPAGYGTLRQNDVSVDIVSGALDLKITPLAESVTRVTAPDTYQRLSALANRYRPEALRRSGAATVSLFLVTAYSESPDVPFVPEDLQLISKGTRLRAAAVVPVSAGWEQQRLRQRQPEMAVYAFAGNVDLESDLVIAYGMVQSAAWNRILPQVRAERARVRARAGGATGDAGNIGTGRPQTSRPYPAILR